MKRRNSYDSDNNSYYLGLDIGTDSIGYAVTDQQYNLLRFHGSDAWGSSVFDAAALKDERRGHRSDRRRLERKKQRVKMLQEIFAKEISKVDERFFVRLEGSYLWRKDTVDRYTLFDESDYTDAEYHKEFPTIHHLICELMSSTEKHDVRLVYLACAWLVSHRGHFLKNIDEKNLSRMKDIDVVFNAFREYFLSNEYEFPWVNVDIEEFGAVLKKKSGVRNKKKELTQVLLNGRKPNKEITENFPFNEDLVLQLLAGGSCKLKDIYAKTEYEELGSVSLSMDDEKMAEIASNIGDDYELINELRILTDWAVLADVLDKAETISQSKVMVYDQHKKDLQCLKYFIKKYCTKEKYKEIFSENVSDNYVRYSYHLKEIDVSSMKNTDKKASVEDFSKYILKELKMIEANGIEEEDRVDYEDMKCRLELREFLPKQKNTDNRIIPHQLYLYELNTILDNASVYLDFLNDVDASGITNKEKVQKIFLFKLPYFVGPLNSHSEFSWVKRTNERITPWNYESVIDFDASEEAFIKRMTNQCTYLPGEAVVPKDSLCYHKFMVLNEINNIRIDGEKISVIAKQKMYCELFEKKKKVKRKDIIDFLICNNYLEKGRENCVSGIDVEIKSNLSTHIAFKRLISNGILNEQEIEDIIERASYAEDKSRVVKYIERKYPKVSAEDIKYITSVKIKDFGRLSKKFLLEFEGTYKATGEVLTILKAMWETNDNLMELLSDRYTFADNLREYDKQYYTDHKRTLSDILDDMYISNAVRRPIYRTLDIVGDVYKAFGTPKKIFVEMTRGTDIEKKGKRTMSRKQQILELYAKYNDEDVRDLKHQLESLGERVDSKLQGDKLFLYFMQGGISAYSGRPIVLERLLTGSKDYDIDHIYPQSFVKDDSIINNKVLVYSEENGKKGNDYPISQSIRNSMSNIWMHWKKIGAISEEKYRRLIRSTPFTTEEKYAFINRQLTETSQSTKAVAMLLSLKFPETEIVYTKAKLASDFRQEYKIYKSRTYNDLHHAVDAYLNIVTGNVYNMKFSHRWFNPDMEYSVKVKTLFKHELRCGGELVWGGEKMLEKVKNTAHKNTAHFTKYTFCRQGALFDQQPVRKKEGLIPLKKGLDTTQYGGYNKSSIMFFIPVGYRMGKKKDIMVMSVEVMHGQRFLADEEYARYYTKERLQYILGKEVDSFDFPLGMRPWKINTMLCFDGFEVCITGSSGAGKQLIMQSLTQFITSDYWKYYIKKLERFVEKVTANPNYIYDEEYDKVNRANNVDLYDLYIDKLCGSVYGKRANSPKNLLIDNRDKFIELDVKEQAAILMNIQLVFGRYTSGCDLSKINGSKNSSVPLMSSTISNWKKNYSDVRIIDRSASGMWEKQSENLLKLL